METKELTPKEKAKELYNAFFCLTPQPYTTETVGGDGKWKDLQFQDWDKDWTNQFPKKSALLCVNEMIDSDSLFSDKTVGLMESKSGMELKDTCKLSYWLEIKIELLENYE